MQRESGPNQGIRGVVINFKELLPGRRIHLHVMAWHGSSGHATFQYNLPGVGQVKYVSSDYRIVADQVSKIKAMGVDVVNIYWRGGQTGGSHLATLRLIAEAERAGLKVSLMLFLDKDSTTASVQSQLAYASQTFFSSEFYLRDESKPSKPIVLAFGATGPVDWNAVQVATPITLIREGFSMPGQGVFGWVRPNAKGENPLNPRFDRIFDFIANARANPDKLAFYPVYPGFNDKGASWTEGRIIERRGELTLRDTCSLVPLEAKEVIVATWNDLEEGSQVEGM
jgi:hypothetical protein